MATEADTASSEPAEGQARERRRPPIVPILVLVAIMGGFVFLFLFRSQPSEQVRRLIDKQLKLAVAGRFDQLWQETLSISVKKACPKESFTGALDQLRASQPDFWTLIAYRDLHIEVKGDQAIVTYVITYNGAPIEWATADAPDLYARADQTVYGPTLTRAEQLQRLESLREQAIVVGKEYEKEKARIMKEGDIRLADAVKGQWYDEIDSHVKCEG